MTEKFEYSVAGKMMMGFHARKPSMARILMLPDWEGCQTASSHRLAKLYADHCDAEVLTTDIYGASNRPSSHQQADSVMQRSLAFPQQTRDTLAAIVGAVEPRWESQGTPLFAVGFCFGGSLAFELARSGVQIDGAVSVHGKPDTILPLTRTTDPSTPEFLMIQGSEDPLITPASLSSFIAEMRTCEADWSLYWLGRAKHSFTRLDMGVGNFAVGYSAKADLEAVGATNNFLRRKRTAKNGPVGH